MPLVRDLKTHTVTDTDTGEVIPIERLDEYARAKLNAALEKLATAWARAVTEKYVFPVFAALDLPTCAKSQTDPNA